MTFVPARRAYGLAVAVLAGATLLRFVLNPWLGSELPLITYFAALLVVAWLTRLGPSLATLAGGAALGYVFFANPQAIDAAPRFALTHQQVDLLRYMLVGAGLVAVCEAMRRAERRALDFQARFEGTLRTALDCVITIDSDDRVVEFNPAAERTFGYARAEALGRDLASLIIPEEVRGAHRIALARHLQSGEATILDRRVELVALRSDGSRIPVELAVTRISTDPPLFTAYLRDISERVRGETSLRESEERYRLVVEQVVDYAIFSTDVAGRATSWNEGVSRVLGFAEPEFLGLDITRHIFTPEDIAAGVPQRELEEAAREGRASDDRWMRRKDGTRFFALGATTALRNAAGDLVGFSKIMRDQTPRKLMENQLRDTAAELGEAMRQQTRFLAVLSHELRNPLAPIRNAVEILRLAGSDPTRANKAVEMIRRQVAHMVHLVDDLLDLSRIRSGKINLRRETIDLVDVVHLAVQAGRAHGASPNQKIVEVLPDESLPVDGDATRISQLVGNLLQNACKFTPAEGRVEVALSRESDEAVLRVRDTGVGIPADQLDRIFGMFTQLGADGAVTHGGLGLGLHLSRALVELHGGRISAASAGPGKGSEFVVRLPLAKAAPASGLRAT
ncbi:MAG TPA: PAS domain S-box protein [Usitatibacter sp.]|nr:PAS domain S-box protein [Usitatibacter sp.]